MPTGKIDYDELSEKIAEKLQEKTPPCFLLSDEDIDTLRDLVKKKKLMGKGFLWLLFAVAGMLLKDLYALISSNLHWGGQ